LLQREYAHRTAAAGTRCSLNSVGHAFGRRRDLLLVLRRSRQTDKNDAFKTWDGGFRSWPAQVLVGVGLYVRLRIEGLRCSGPPGRALPARVPVCDAVTISAASLSRRALTAISVFYIGSVFITGYAGRNPKASHGDSRALRRRRS